MPITKVTTPVGQLLTEYEVRNTLAVLTGQFANQRVLAGSALRARYRKQLVDDYEEARIVCLKGSYDLIWARMEQRTDHYMKSHMLTRSW